MNKSNLVRSAHLFLTLLFLGWCAAYAQDIAKVAPKNAKVLLDNEEVRVIDVYLKAGEKLPMHSHPPNVVYSVTTGKVKTTLPDGQSRETDFKTGEAQWSGAVVHANEALTDIHVIVTELKEIRIAKQVDKDLQSNKDAIINDLNNLSAHSYQYRIRPQSMGGGQGAYTGYAIPQKLQANENASYAVQLIDGNLMRFTATSTKGFGTIGAELDQDGRLSKWIYTGKFQ